MTNRPGWPSEQAKENLILGSVLVSVACIPVGGPVSSISIVAMVILGLLWGRSFRPDSPAATHFFGFLILFGIYLLGLLYTPDFDTGLQDIERKLVLLFIPFFFAFIPTFPAKNLNRIFDVHIGICLFLSLISLGIGLGKFQAANFEINQFPDLLANQVLGGYVGIHSTYLSIFILLAIMALYEHKLKTGSSKSKAFYLAIMVFLLLFLLLLASRIILLSYLVLIVMIILKDVVAKRNNPVILTLILFSGLSLFSLFYLKNDYFKSRVNEAFQIDFPNLIGNDNENGVTQRIFFWSNALQIIEKAPVFGHGTGSSREAFRQQYNHLLSDSLQMQPSVKEAIQYFRDNNYNCHNQYVEMTLSHGIVGLSILLMILGYSFFIAWKNRNFLHLSFLIIMTLSFLTESVLERQWGITFFAFYNSLFFADEGKLAENQKKPKLES